jgi:predicted ATPase/DNA-binding SARP family transcriptional activator
MTCLWRVELLGALCARQEDRVVSHFRTHKTGSLLAYLAYYRHLAHSREVLIDLLWPEDTLSAGQLKLRLALTSLRRQLEPSGAAAGTVLMADRKRVQLNPDAVTTDVAAFESALQAAETASDPERVSLLAQAVDLYRGVLLPGHYDPWIPAQLVYLEERYFQAVQHLIALLECSGDRERALCCALRAVGINPLQEELQQTLMALYVAAGRPADALKQYQELERTLRRALGEAPSPHLQALAQRLRARPGSSNGATRRSEVSEPPVLAKADSHSLPSPVPSALPMPGTRFFGREPEIARLKALLASPASSRLVTLTGPGGSGKTRLAVQAAAALEEAFAGALWFVPLADISDPDRAPSAILQALGIPHVPGREPMEQVAAALARQRALLLLDNFEQLIPAGVPLVQTLRERVPTLTCLVTSRQLLGLTGEQAFPVETLPIPTGADPPERLMGCASVQLFVDRAQLAQPDFRLTRANSRAVATLCDRLEGLPLAIELAAAWANVLSPAQMLGHLGRRLDFLFSRKQDAAPRHRTLRAALDWSLQLLSPELLRFFAALSVFRGGWTSEAAEKVCPDSPVLTLLGELRDRSLILSEDSGTEVRFGMLETLREYAAEKLAPPEGEVLAERHAHCYAALVEAAEAAWWSSDEERWIVGLDREQENLRAALRWALDNTVEGALRMMRGLVRFWYVRGYLDEGRTWLQEALTRSEGRDSPDRAWALSGAGLLAREQADYPQAETLLHAALRMHRAHGDTPGQAVARQRLGLVASDRRDYVGAYAHLEQALALQQEQGNRPGTAVALVCLGRTALRQGEHTQAHRFCERSLVIFRALKHRWGIATTLYMLGVIASNRSEYVRAIELYEETLRIHRDLSNPRGTALCLLGIGTAALRLTDYARARQTLKKCSLVFQDIGDKWGLLQTLETLADLCRAEGQAAQAARLVGAASAWRDALGAPVPPNEQSAQDALIEALRNSLGEPAFTHHQEAGRLLAWEQVVEEMLRT